MDQQTPRDRVRNIVDLLVPDWRPTASQVLWGIRIALVLGILVLIGYPYGITLWEWAQLLVVPAVIAAGGAWFNSRQNARERFTQELRAQDDVLQKYVDYKSKVITDGKLYRSSDDLSLKEARITIRAQTLAVLTRLSDPYRKASILQFMYEAGLIDGKDPFVSVLGPNLQGVNLSKIGSTLEGINLRYAFLNKGIFSQALEVATGISNKTLEQQARSLKGATMPDGSKHDLSGSGGALCCT